MNFERVNPIHCIDGNVILTEYGDISFCFKIELKELNTITVNTYNAMHTALVQMLAVLPENTLIHRQDVFVNRNYNAENLELNKDFFGTSLENHYNNRTYRNQSSYLYITFLDSLAFKRDIDITKYFKKIKSTSDFMETVSQFEAICAKAIATISGDFSIEIFQENDLRNAIERHYNGYEENKISTAFFKPEFKIGDKYFAIYGLDEDKNQKDGDISLCITNNELSSEMSKLYNCYLSGLGYTLNTEHVVNTFIFYDNQESIKKELVANQGKLRGIKGLKAGNDVASSRLDNFLTLVEVDSAKIVRSNMNVTIFNSDKDRLKKEEKNLQTVFSKIGVVPTEYTYLDYPYIFISNTPGCGGHLPFSYTFITIDQIAFLYSIYEGNKINEENKKGLIYTNRLNNIPEKIDTFFKPYESKLIDNRNYIRIAPSGAGKSFDQRATSYEQYLMGFDQILINIGGDHKMTALINEYSRNKWGREDAVYIKYEQGKTLDINPFYVEDFITNDKIEFLISFIWLLWGGSDEINSDKHSVLNKIIELYYDIDTAMVDATGRFIVSTKNKELSINSFYDFIATNQEKITEQFGNDTSLFSLTSLKLNLEKFARGNYSNLFVKTKPSLFEKKKYVEFELDNIKDHPFLFTVFTMLISDITFNTMWVNDGNYKDFMIDEAWKIIEKKDSGMALLLKFLYKTIRKFDGAVGIAIQQITDLSHDVVVENAILGNCSIKHIYNHKNVLAQVPILKEKLSLKENDIAQLLSIRNKQQLLYPGDKTRYSEKLLVLGSEFAKVVRIETSPELAVIYDSEKSRLKKFDELMLFSDGVVSKAVELYLTN